MPTELANYSVEIGVDQQLGADLRVAPHETVSNIAIVEHTLPPGKLAAPLHRHTLEDEISFVLDGKMGVLEDGEVSIIEAGEFAVKNRDVWHTFWNPGPEPLRFLEIISPGAFAGYFKEVAELLPEAGPRDDETIKQLEDLGARYGFDSDFGSVPTLKEKFDLDE